MKTNGTQSSRAGAAHNGRRPLQTYLFVPAHEPGKAARAMASNAGAVIFDLEASVPQDQKAAARQCIGDYLGSLVTMNSPEVWVRVNVGDPDLTADLQCVPLDRVAGVVVPQAEDPDTLRRVQAAGAPRLIPLIESAVAFGALEQLSGVEAVERFAIGTWDLLVDLGLLGLADPDESELIWRLRGDLVIASRQLRLEPPLDGVYAILNDENGFGAACQRALRLGFAGKLLIHPRQIPAATSVFGPNESELRLARELIEAYEAAVQAGRGAIQIRGQMVDGPVVARARSLLARWHSCDLLDALG